MQHARPWRATQAFLAGEAISVQRCGRAHEAVVVQRLHDRNAGVVAGGVGANQMLRSRLNVAIGKRGGNVFYPDLEFCTDNGAMIAFAGAMRLQQQAAQHDYRFIVKPRWDLRELNYTD